MSGEFEQDADAIRTGQMFEAQRRDAGVPAVALEFSTAWCMSHLEPFHEEWPAGAGLAMLKLFEAFVADERVAKMTDGDAMRIAAVVHEWSPLCCFVSPEALAQVYRECGKSCPS